MIKEEHDLEFNRNKFTPDLRCLCYHVFNRVQIFFVSLYLSDELKATGYKLKETIIY